MIGGVAVAIWGEPRVTRDVDLKVLMGRDEAEQLLAALAPDYVSLLSDARTALRQQAMVFVQDAAGTRLDLLLADTLYDVLAVYLLHAEVGACSDSVWRGRRFLPALSSCIGACSYFCA